MANELLAKLLELPRPEALPKEKLGYYSVQLNIHEPGTKEFEEIEKELRKFGVEVPKNYLGVVVTNWYENFTEAPEYVAQTTTTGFDLETKIEDLEKRDAQIKETQENAKEAVAKAQEKLREIKARNDEILKNLEKQKDKKLYVEIKSPTEDQFTKEETIDFENYKEYLQSVKTEEVPEAVEKLAQEIETRIGNTLKEQGLDNEEIKLATENTAAEIIDNIIKSDEPSYTPPTHYVAVASTFEKHPEEISKITSDKETQDLIKTNIQDISSQASLQVNIFRKYTEAAFGKEAASKIFGPEPKTLTISISETPQPTFTETYSPYSAVYSAQMSFQNHDENLEELKQRGLEEGKRVLIQDARSLMRHRLELIHPQSAARKFSTSNQGDFILRSFGVGPQDGLSAVESLAVRVGLPITAGVKTAIWAKATTQTAISIANTGGIMQMEAFLGGAGQAASQAAVKTGLLATAGSLLTKGAAAIGVSLGAFTFGVSTAVTLVLTAIGKMINWPRVKEWLRKNGWILGFGAVAINPWLGIGLAGAMYGLTRQIRLAAIGAGIWGFFGAIGSAFVITIGTPIIVTLLVLPPLVAFIMLVINSGAYLVPPIPAGGSIIHIPPGGNLTKCDPNLTGEDITDRLASSMQSGSVYLLPDSVTSRQEGICMDPTMIVLHTSGGFDNDDGNARTYETLVQSDLSCQMATDTNETILMLSFFETQVEYSWCANDLNNGGVSIEMAGECQGGGCAPVSKCSPGTDLTYTPDGPHPCPPLEDLAFSAICKVMQEYKIPWTQVFQHEASNGSHTDPVGDEWVDKFIIRLKDNCVVDMN